MTDLTERATELREPPPVRGGDDPPLDAPAPTLPEGVELTRLLALVRLTAAQALELGAGLLAGTAERGDPLVPDRAIVSTDGRVVLGPAPDGGRGGAPDLPTTLADVAAAARLRGRPPDPAAEQLLAELDRAAAELPDVGAPALAARVHEALAGTDRDGVRAELAALVRAVNGRSAPALGSGPAGPPSTGARPAPARRATPRQPRTSWRRIGAWLLSVLVLGAVVVAEVVVLRDDITADVGLLLDAGRSGATESTAPEPDGKPIVPPAPASAGSVTAVDLRPLLPCAPGAACTVSLQVRLTPAPADQVVTWSYRIVDRCTGVPVPAPDGTVPVPGGTATVPAGGQRIAVVGSVALPALPAVAVLAVTDVPAVAASPPVFAGSCLPGQPVD